jgi:prophage antirepressor-like protein
VKPPLHQIIMTKEIGDIMQDNALTTRDFLFRGLPVRVIEQGGEVWFRAEDVCAALGYANPRQALSSHVDGDDAKKLKTITSQGPQSVNYINESGLYSLVLRSHRPEAKAFKRWVTHDVLPTLRKTGLFSIKDIVARVCATSEAPDTAFVYVIRSTASGMHKIGVTTNIEHRMASLRFGFEAPYELVGVIPVPYAKRYVFERMFHEVLGIGRSHGEWFEGVDEQRFVALGGRYAEVSNDASEGHMPPQSLPAPRSTV